jgi:hypothetical protein
MTVHYELNINGGNVKYYSPNNLPLSRDSNPRIREYEFTLTNETVISVFLLQ